MRSVRTRALPALLLLDLSKDRGWRRYAINLGARADSLEVTGREHTRTYRACIVEGGGEVRVSGAERVFCSRCGSALWIHDPAWPDLVHPFAGAIDTPLPDAPERVHIQLASKASWVPVRAGSSERHCDQFAEETLEEWHRRHRVL